MRFNLYEQTTIGIQDKLRAYETLRYVVNVFYQQRVKTPK
jgi:hypothetical protein